MENTYTKMAVARMREFFSSVKLIDGRTVASSSSASSVRISAPTLVKKLILVKHRLCNSLAINASDSANQFISGAIGGLAGLAIGHPMDTIKIIMQNSSKRTDVYHVIQILKEGGIGAFFRGISLPFYSYSLVNAFTFAAYKGTVGVLDPTERSPIATMLAGSVAGFAQLLPSIPVEVVKIRQQLEAGQCPLARGQTVIECMRGLVREKGVRGLYAGAGVQAARDIPAFTAYFFTYTEANKLGEYLGLDPLLTTFYAGGLGGAVSWGISMPMDVLKTRLQAGTETTVRSAYQNLIRTEGYRSLFRGFNVVVARALIVNASIFVVYEEAYKWLSRPATFACAKDLKS